MEPTKKCIVRCCEKNSWLRWWLTRRRGSEYCKLYQVFLSLLSLFFSFAEVKDLNYYKAIEEVMKKPGLCNSILMYSTLLLGWSQSVFTVGPGFAVMHGSHQTCSLVAKRSHFWAAVLTFLCELVWLQRYIDHYSPRPHRIVSISPISSTTWSDR